VNVDAVAPETAGVHAILPFPAQDIFESMKQSVKISAVIFRLRFWIITAIFVLAFTAPWDRWFPLGMDRNGSTWLLLSTWMARNGWLSFTAATIAVLVFGIVCALVGALLRTWGSAYLGSSTVHSGAMHGDAVVAAGPFRYVRNPLYLGTWLHTAALALLMPPSGAILAIVLIIAFQLFLIVTEERYLDAKLGAPYAEYRARVPRLLPALRPKVASSGIAPTWRSAFLGEIYFWGVLVSFLAVGWRYNASLITQGVLISLGVWFVLRGLMPRRA
jgi:protein-S-isoprenylcysteine O-methyltransferase Ste14